MNILEAREQRLRAQLFGVHAAPSASASLTDKISNLNGRLEHLYSAITGFPRLVDMYNGVQKELEMQPSSTLGSAVPRVGDEIKRALVLSSDERVAEIVRELRQLQELQGVLALLEQLRNRNVVDEQQLQALERRTDSDAQRALQLHARIERLLAVYHEMISSQMLSEKCVEYSVLLDELA